MSSILVLFASHYGQTRAIAERITDRLRRGGHAVDLVDLRYARRDQPVPQDYEAVVLGSRVEAGRHASAIISYVRSYADALCDVPTAVFSVSMAASRPSAGQDPNGYLDALFTELGWRPTRAIAFAGALPYRKYGWLMRRIMKRISRSAGHPTDTSRNYELTDWNRVDAFADEIAAMIPRERDVRWIRPSPSLR